MSRAQDTPLGPPRFGSDLIVRALVKLGIDQVSMNPGATLRGFHESLVHAGQQGGPSLILCPHEEIAVGLAHGYAKTEGRMMAVAIHDLVGLQHASMAIFNAWCDRVPILLIGGSSPMNESGRRPWIDWIHTASTQGQFVRDFVKWETQVFSVDAIEETVIRAAKVAMTPPCAPVYVCIDIEDQEVALPTAIPDASPAAQGTSPAPASEDVEVVLERLLHASLPVLVVDRYREGPDAEASRTLVELAERLQAPVIDLHGRSNLPSDHPLNVSEAREEVLASADVLLALDTPHLARVFLAGSPTATGPAGARVTRPDVWSCSVTCETTPLGSWAADYGKPQSVDHEVGVTGISFAKALLERLAHRPATISTGDRAQRVASWRTSIDERWQQKLEERWSAQPISTERLLTELGSALKERSWVLANTSFVRTAFDRMRLGGPDSFHIGGSGGEGLGYGLSASLGAALSCRGTGRIAVDIQGDGDLLFVPSGMWVAAANRLPLLFIVHNNGSYHQDEMHQKNLSEVRQRGDESSRVGIKLDPNIDYAAVARGFGVRAEGPITDPDDLLPALERAVSHIEETGMPALIDVISAPR